MRKTGRFGAALLLLSVTLAATVANADGEYRRNGELFDISVEGYLLYCARQSDAFEVCGGLNAKNNAEYFGDTFMFPDRPGEGPFTGTIVFDGNRATIRFCGISTPSDCSRERWRRQN